ncbi:MAG: hypothetical protein RLZZ153_1954, partial [Pseudomonadota bacterium]
LYIQDNHLGAEIFQETPLKVLKDLPGGPLAPRLT